MSAEMELVCDKEVIELFKEAIVEVKEGFLRFFSSLFLMPKKAGGFRPIVNLKPLNNFIRYEDFKMEGFDTVKSLIRKGDWLVKLDLKDAYLTLSVQPKIFTFFLERPHLSVYVLAFGLFPAPRIFTKLMKAAVGFLRERGLRLIIYLDDLLLMNESKSALVSDSQMAVSLFESLGFIINWGKNHVTPKLWSI
jgi:hypothetical protein